MITCPRCQYRNGDAETLCIRCHFVLTPNKNAKTTTSINFDDYKSTDAQARFILPAPKEAIVRQVQLIIKFGNAFNKQVSIKPGDKIVLGRVAQVSQNVTTVNLSDIGAWELGVSRMHTMLTLSDTDLYVTDLGTVNGTWIDGRRLPAYSPRKIEDGMVLRLGALKIEARFAKPAEDIVDESAPPQLYILTKQTVE